MPGQFARRAEFYHQLGALTGAGLGLVRGLETLKRNPPARSYREPINGVLEQLGHGYTFTESLQRVGHWLPGFDIALLQAGEKSGRLEACFSLLADYYRDRAQLSRRGEGRPAAPAKARSLDARDKRRLSAPAYRGQIRERAAGARAAQQARQRVLAPRAGGRLPPRSRRERAVHHWLALELVWLWASSAEGVPERLAHSPPSGPRGSQTSRKSENAAVAQTAARRRPW